MLSWGSISADSLISELSEFLANNPFVEEGLKDVVNVSMTLSIIVLAW